MNYEKQCFFGHKTFCLDTISIVYPFSIKSFYVTDHFLKKLLVTDPLLTTNQSMTFSTLLFLCIETPIIIFLINFGNTLYRKAFFGS